MKKVEQIATEAN